MENKQKVSKYLSFLLRHHPEKENLYMDEHGWVSIKELEQVIPIEDLEDIVATDNKQRYSFNEDKTKIRANQGHSIPVDVELIESEPPEFLYHGTGEKYIESILEQGLIPKSRLYVHLSSNIETAINVGKRHGEPVVLKIFAKRMYEDGEKFYLSKNKVWLVNSVNRKYFQII